MHAAVRLHIVRAMCGGASGGWASNDHVTLKRESVCFKGGSSTVNNYNVVSISDFNSHWIEVLTHCDIPDPYWSVKWITEHVQKTIIQSDSSPQGVPRSVSKLLNEETEIYCATLHCCVYGNIVYGNIAILLQKIREVIYWF